MTHIKGLQLMLTACKIQCFSHSHVTIDVIMLSLKLMVFYGGCEYHMMQHPH